jgi:hypothetical protein
MQRQNIRSHVRERSASKSQPLDYEVLSATSRLTSGRDSNETQRKTQNGDAPVVSQFEFSSA